MGLNGCCGVIKYLVVLVNLIFWLVGLATVVLAIWMLTDPTFLISMTQDENHYYIGLYIFLAIGALMLIVAFLGCCGAFKESQCMLVSFFCCLLIILVAEVAAGVWAFQNKQELSKMVQASVKHTVKEEYGIINSRTIAFDAIQKHFECCGASGPQDWASSRLNTKGKDGGFLDMKISSLNPLYTIPESCCKKGTEKLACETSVKGGISSYINPAINSEGCVDKLVTALKENMPIVVAVFIGIITVEVLGLIFSLVLCCAIKRNDHYKA
ncbi:CD9 antigen [Phlebotomus argentipes]|uniref:CD9 antigen n=1 Tax=Phlebotomus argentipes TaxID=94469 RepID=UPI0028932D5E|nr:CD9 antigen [Phlebotomus argentipes]